MSLILTLALVGGFAPGSLNKVNAKTSSPDTIYYNGKVITMDEKETITDAVAVKDGKIISVGKDADIKALKANNTKMVDLNGKVMLPGFYDAHSHFPYTGYI